jgi:L-fucose dehydrogenase
MDLQLENKIIVVTGGASGIGHEIALVLAREGAMPVIIDRDDKKMKKTVDDITRAGGKAAGVHAELANPEQCRAAIDEVVNRWGRIEGFVYNPGMNDAIGLENGNPGGFLESISNNLLHYYAMARYMLPELKKSKGAIVNIGSKVAVTGQGQTPGHATANGGRNALTREWAVELLPYGIRVNSVIVAEYYTPLFERGMSGFNAPQQEPGETRSPVRLQPGMKEAAQIAAGVAFLLSPRSGHTTGQMLYIDGDNTHPERKTT